MKTMFLFLVTYYVSCLNTLAERKKKENYVKSIVNLDIKDSKIFYDFDQQGKMIFRSSEPLNNEQLTYVLPPYLCFSNRILC
jgi:hypothetical protein